MIQTNEFLLFRDPTIELILFYHGKPPHTKELLHGGIYIRKGKQEKGIRHHKSPSPLTQQMLFLLGIVDNARCGAYNLVLPRLDITLNYTSFFIHLLPP